MWHCVNCGANVQRGAVCTACGRPMNEALSEIVRKSRRVKLRGGVVSRWAWRGEVTGFIVGSVLSLFFGAIELVLHWVWPRGQETVGEILAIVLFLFIAGGVILLPLLFAVIFVVFGTIIKPIFVALFCSVDRFEQEYDSSRPWQQ